MPLTEQEEFELLSLEREKANIGASPIGEVISPQTFQRQELESTIAQRPDIYGQAIESARKLSALETARRSPLQNFAQEAQFGLQSLGGVAQRGEAAIANPLLEMGAGRGTYKDLLPRMAQGIKQGITGERLGELGDVGRQAGLPEPISAGLGLVGTGLIGGVLSKGAGLSQKAGNLSKIQTAYGKDLGKNMIKWSTGMPDQAVEHGMKKGWNRVLIKENLNPQIPTNLAKKVMNNLDDIARTEYDEFGKVIDKIKTGNVKAIDLNQVVENELVGGGYLDQTFRPTLKSRGTLINKIDAFVKTAQSNKVSPNTDIPVDVVQSFKGIVKKFIPKGYFEGKVRNLNDEQKLATKLYRKLDNLIGYNAYGIEDVSYTQAKSRYSEFKNFEKAILDTFSERVGQDIKPTADKIVGLFDLHSTESIEELNKINAIDTFMKNKGYGGIADKLMDWLTTQSAVVKPQTGGASLYPFRLLAESTKYGTRQFLKSGATQPIGKGIEATGRLLKPARQVVNQGTTIPPSILRLMTGRNK